MWRYRIKVLNISIISNIRLFDIDANSSFEAGRIAATILFGKPFIEDDFECRKFWFRKKYLLVHKRMESLKAEVEIRNVYE